MATVKMTPLGGKTTTFRSRRTALQMLGFGGAAAAAVGTEAFSMPTDKPGDINSVTGAFNKERYAKALANLATELRSDRVMIEHLKVWSSLEADEIADRHTLELRFIFKPEA